MGFQHPHPNTFGYIVPLEKGRRGFLIIANTDEELLTSTSYLTKLKSVQKDVVCYINVVCYVALQVSYNFYSLGNFINLFKNHNNKPNAY